MHWFNETVNYLAPPIGRMVIGLVVVAAIGAVLALIAYAGGYRPSRKD